MISSMSEVGEYVPDRGHIVWLTFDPSAGREQRGRRPAIVLSPADYNRRVRLALVCPITSRQKGYPFEVALLIGMGVAGVILVDHVRSVDWTARRAEFAGQAPAPVLREVVAKLAPLVGTE